MATFSFIDGTTEMPEGDNVFRIPSINYDRFVDSVNALNKRAKRIGVVPATIEKLGEGIALFPVYDRHTGERTDKVQLRYVDVRVTGEIPVLNGWRFVATIQHAGEAGNILRMIPNETMPERFRDASPEWCDHCGKNRARKDTYIVTDGTDYKQVGSSCLKDFTGTNASPETIAKRAEWLFEMMGRCRDASMLGEDNGTSLSRFLAYTGAVIRAYGWMSKTQARIDFAMPTASIVDLCMGNEPPMHDSRGNITEAYEMWSKINEAFSDDDKAFGDTVVAWVREYLGEKETLNDYEYNVRTVTASDFINARMYGIAASVVPMYHRALEQEIKRQQKPESPNMHVGTIGKRETFTVTVLSIIESANDYGTVDITKMADTEGNILVWFNSGSIRLERGETVKLTGTVKAHNNYKGENQTILTRCKLAK